MSHFWDTIRYRYEFGGEDLVKIAADNDIILSELIDYAEQQGWTVQTPPGYADDDIKTNEYYSRVRRKLTGLMSQRALGSWPKIVSLEDKFFKSIETTLDFYNTSNDNIVDPGVLKQLIVTYVKLVENNKIYAEAINTPAMNDKNITPLLDNLNTLAEMSIEDQLTARGIPVPDIDLEDIE